jgi:hypothetical protein
MDDFAGGFAPGTGGLFRLIGVGWIGALLVVGVTILAARWLIGWQMRRVDRIVAQKAAGEAAAKEGQGAGAEIPEG